jgi:methionyl-tRNA synthetase
MPQVRRQGPVRRQLRVCGAVYAPTDLKNPYSALSGATPVLKPRSTSSSSCPTRAASNSCATGRSTAAACSRSGQQGREWLDGEGGLGDWDISRDAPYFGIEIPDAPGKYFYVWLDAPIGYLASLKNYFGKTGRTSTPGRRPDRADPLHRQGHRLLPHPVLARHAEVRRPQDARQRFVHGFLTVNGEKMSSRAAPASRRCATWTWA